MVVLAVPVLYVAFTGYHNSAFTSISVCGIKSGSQVRAKEHLHWVLLGWFAARCDRGSGKQHLGNLKSHAAIRIGGDSDND